MLRPALVERIEKTAPIDEVNHGSKPAGSRAALTGIECHRCGEKGHTGYHSMEMADKHLKQINANFDVGDIPYLCERCANRFDYTDVTEIEENDLSEEVELHGQKLRELNR